MDEGIEKLRKRAKKRFEGMAEVDDSDIPVHEKRVKEEDIQMLRRKKQ